MATLDNDLPKAEPILARSNLETSDEDGMIVAGMSRPKVIYIQNGADQSHSEMYTDFIKP